MVCNAGWIEATAGKFGFYAEGSGRAVARVMDAIDHERLALAGRLGVRAVPFTELFHQLGFTWGERAHAGGAYHAIQHSDLIQPIQSPPQLDHRYLHEDVGWGLVPWMHLAAAAGSPAPTISALTHLAGVINGIDYPREGLTLERMGLARKTPSEIRAHVGAPTAELAGVPAPKSCRQVRDHPRRAGSARSAPSTAI
jgi:opine dehydrogenase